MAEVMLGSDHPSPTLTRCDKDVDIDLLTIEAVQLALTWHCRRLFAIVVVVVYVKRNVASIITAFSPALISPRTLSSSV